MLRLSAAASLGAARWSERVLLLLLLLLLLPTATHWHHPHSLLMYLLDHTVTLSRDEAWLKVQTVSSSFPPNYRFARGANETNGRFQMQAA